MKSVEIESQILAVCGDVSITLTATGKKCLVRCPQFNLSTFVRRIFPLVMRGSKFIHFLHDRFLAEQISLTFELAGRPVFSIGYSSKPGPISYLLGLYPFEIRSAQFCAAMLASIKVEKKVFFE